jgi:hypothetical protein
MGFGLCSRTVILHAALDKAMHVRRTIETRTVPLAAVDADLDLFLVSPAPYMIMRQNIAVDGGCQR